MFHIAKVRSIAGTPLYEVVRTADNQTMTEPFRTRADCYDYLKSNREHLEKIATTVRLRHTHAA